MVLILMGWIFFKTSFRPWHRRKDAAHIVLTSPNVKNGTSVIRECDISTPSNIMGSSNSIIVKIAN
jgi:hypothetical protein